VRPDLGLGCVPPPRSPTVAEVPGASTDQDDPEGSREWHLGGPTPPGIMTSSEGTGEGEGGDAGGSRKRSRPRGPRKRMPRDPSSGRRLCHAFNHKGDCSRGENCLYLHRLVEDVEGLRPAGASADPPTVRTVRASVERGLLRD
jgi:hypothetical protein